MYGFREFSFEEKIGCLLTFLFPIFFLTLKSWTNTFYFLILCGALLAVAAHPGRYLRGVDRLTWLVVILFLTPFLAELISQLGRHTLSFRSLDSPSRFLGGALILLYFSSSRISREILFSFCLGSCIGCAVTFMSLLLNQENFWSADRAATYFVDPNNLGFNILLLITCSVYLILYKGLHQGLKTCISLCVILGVYVLLISGSRTSWFSFLVVVEVLLLVSFWKNRLLLLLAHLILICSFIVLWGISDLFGRRLHELSEEISNIGLQSDATSAGFRFRLFLLDLELVKQNYLFGTLDGNLPPYSELKTRIGWLNYRDYNMMVVSGAHSEFMAQLVRKGIVFGFAALVSTFLYPTWFFARRLRSVSRREREIALLVVMILASILVSGWAIEFSNLKMNASFLSTFFAISYSCFLSKKARS